MKVFSLVMYACTLHISCCTSICNTNSVALTREQHIQHYAWFEKILAHLNAQPAYESNQLPNKWYKTTTQGFLLEVNKNTNHLQKIITPWGAYNPKYHTDSISKFIQTKYFKEERGLSTHYLLHITHIEDKQLPEAQEICLENTINQKLRSQNINLWHYLKKRKLEIAHYYMFEKLRDILFELKEYPLPDLSVSAHRTTTGFIIEADDQHIFSIYTPWGKFNLQDSNIAKNILLYKDNHEIYKDNQSFQSQFTLYALSYIHDQTFPTPAMIQNVSEMNKKASDFGRYKNLYELLYAKLPKNNLQALCIEKISQRYMYILKNSIESLPSALQYMLHIYNTLDLLEYKNP